MRLHSQKISTVNESFHHELERLSRGRESPTLDSQPEQSVNSYLVRWGFCNIPARVTIPFPTEVHNDKPGRMYASLYAHSKLWVMDYEVNCARYGCLSIVKASAVTHTPPQGQEELYVSQTNPSPVWIPRRTGDSPLPRVPIIKSGIDGEEGDLYFGRSSIGGLKPCKVTTKVVKYAPVFDCWSTTSGEKVLSGEILQDTGHELVRAKIDDPVPPNAVIAGLSETDGTLYLGRVGGSIPCAVSTEKDKIKNFCFYAAGVKQVESGEIVVLTK